MGMGLARSICNTNAKLAIKTEERANRFMAELFSLFSAFPFRVIRRAKLLCNLSRRYEFAFGFAKMQTL